jgi:hypothetical protein
MRNFLVSITFAAAACAARPAVPTAVRNAALELYTQGRSLDDIASALSLADRSEARTAIHDAMMEAMRRYYSDR